MSLRPLKVSKLHSPVEVNNQQIFSNIIERIWCASINLPKVKDDPGYWYYYEYRDNAPKSVMELEDAVDSNGKLLNNQPAYDKLISAEV